LVLGAREPAADPDVLSSERSRRLWDEMVPGAPDLFMPALAAD